jgi:hypothetical protein
VAAAFVLLLAPTARTGTRAVPPTSFVESALCVHSSWHYTSHRPTRSSRPEYVLWRHGYWRTWKTYGNGEGAWSTVNSYGGGLQFTLGTWNNAARWSGGSVPHASSNWEIAKQPPRVQILAAFFAVMHRGNWGDWPNTSRACGLR